MSYRKGTMLSTDQFSYSSKNRRFIAEMSALGDPLITSRLYEDSIDVGFFLESSVTGEQVPCLFHSTDFDNEGEIQGWRFNVWSVHNPELNDIQVLIIND